MDSKQADKIEKAGKMLEGIKKFFKNRAAAYTASTKVEELMKIGLPPYLKKAGGGMQGFSMNYSEQDKSIHERYTFKTKIIDVNKLKGKLEGKMYTESFDAITFEKAEFGNIEVREDTVEVAKKMNNKNPTKIEVFELFEVLSESLITPEELAEQFDENNNADSYEQKQDNQGNGPQESEDNGVASDTET